MRKIGDFRFLAQPYMINTIEITPAVTLTSYQVAVSVDKTNWTAIRQLNDLWETVKFPLQPVLYIKITEMANRHGVSICYMAQSLVYQLCFSCVLYTGLSVTPFK